MTDPIADMLTRIRNAIAAKHSRVDIPASKLKLEVARILKEEGYINNFVVKGEGVKRTIRIFLRYDARGTSSITHLERVSRPGRRVYMGATYRYNPEDATSFRLLPVTDSDYLVQPITARCVIPAH